MSNIEKLNEESSAKKIDKIKDQQAKAKEERETAELKRIRRKSEEEIDYTMDDSVKQLFLNLTKMQIPFDFEKTLEEFFPTGMKKDAHGNYYIKIGETKSMFCGHLDTYCYEYKKVWHVIKAGNIYSDGTTTLGGDDKAGIVIMIKMIEAGVPGLYYFFRGEEGVTSPNGTWGSKEAIKSYKENFKKYDRCIAFDRKGSESIITQQMYTECCSSGFSHALISDLGQYGLTYKEDDTGMWCDSGVFMETIPECTNISVGYVNEHTFREKQDINHLDKLVTACINIKWEELPTDRDPTKVTKKFGRYNYDYDFNWGSYGGGYTNSRHDWDGLYSREDRYKRKNYSTTTKRDYVTMDEMFEHVAELLKEVGYSSLNNLFEEAEEMYFQNYDTNDFFGLRIIDFEIFVSEDDTLKSYEHVGDLKTFEEWTKTLDSSNIDDLDDQANRHLDSIANELRGEEEEEEDLEFTANQTNAFKEFSKNNKKLVETILEDIKIKNVIEVAPNTWIQIDKLMDESNLIADYGDYGISPDDYVEWIAYNWDWVVALVTDGKTESDSDINKKKPEVTTLSEKDGIYYDIALNLHSDEVKQFLEQVIEKGHMSTVADYDKYQKPVEDWIKDKYSKELNNETKNINYKTFIDWIKSHKNDLVEYYK